MKTEIHHFFYLFPFFLFNFQQFLTWSLHSHLSLLPSLNHWCNTGKLQYTQTSEPGASLLPELQQIVVASKKDATSKRNFFLQLERVDYSFESHWLWATRCQHPHYFPASAALSGCAMSRWCAPLSWADALIHHRTKKKKKIWISQSRRSLTSQSRRRRRSHCKEAREGASAADELSINEKITYHTIQMGADGEVRALQKCPDN